MLRCYFEKYKKYLIFFLLILTSLTLLLYYFQEEKKVDKKQLQKEKTIEEKKTIQDKSIISEKEKKTQKKELSNTPTLKTKEKTKLSKKEEKVVLYSTNSNDGKYSIELLSSRKIENLNTDSKQIVLTASITDNYEESLFSMSIRENYIKDTSILSLEIEDKKNALKSICEGYFLDSLSSGFSYHMKIEFSENLSECYILSQSDFIEEDYSPEEKKYVEIKDGAMGVLADKQIKIEDLETFKKEKISKILE